MFLKMLFKKSILYIQPCRTIWYKSNNFYCENVKNNYSSNSVNLVYDIYEDKRTETSKAHALFISHGLLGQKNNFKSVTKALLATLEPARKIIVVDNRNHGDSPHTQSHSYELMSADFIRLLDRLNISQVNLLGHSMGGRAAMYTALKYPERVSSLIVEDISPIIHDSSDDLGNLPILFDAFKNIELEKRTGKLAIVRKEILNELKNVVEDLGTRQFFVSNIKQNNDGSFSWRFNLETLRNDIKNIRIFPNTGNAQYKGPVYFLMGIKSTYVREEDFNDIKKIFPNVEFQYVEKSGHWIHYENSEAFVKYVTNFLNKLKT